MMLSRLNSEKCFLFSNDFALIDAEVNTILESEWDTIVMFGHKPSIKGLQIEQIARSNGEVLSTNYNLSELDSVLKEHHIDFKFSSNPGTSYCNYAYYQMLRLVKEKRLDTKVIFIHLPYIDKFRQMDEVVKLLKE